jgi:hypothetical protein
MKKTRMASENSRYLLHGTARREAFSLKDILPSTVSSQKKAYFMRLPV